MTARRGGLAALLVVAVAGAAVGIAWWQNVLVDNSDVLLRAQGLALRATGCVGGERKEAGRVACLIRSMSVARGLRGQAIRFELSRAPSLDKIPVEVRCVRSLWLAGPYTCTTP